MPQQSNYIETTLACFQYCPRALLKATAKNTNQLSLDQLPQLRGLQPHHQLAQSKCHQHCETSLHASQKQITRSCKSGGNSKLIWLSSAPNQAWGYPVHARNVDSTTRQTSHTRFREQTKCKHTSIRPLMPENSVTDMLRNTR